MKSLIADEVAVHWMNTAKVVPTRRLQLSFEKANESYEQLTDFSIVLSILRNEPSIVPPELITTLEKLHGIINSPRYKAQASELSRSKGKYSGTISPLKQMMQKYLSEIEQGIHQYEREQDYSIKLIEDWMENQHKQNVSAEEFHILGVCDYMRILARVIDNFSEKDLLISGRPRERGVHSIDYYGDREDGSSFYYSSDKGTLIVPATGSVLKDSAKLGGMNKKKLVKTLKSFARKANQQSSFITDHQDIMMMLVKDKICIRPASFVLDGSWQISSSGSNTQGTVYNMLTEKSPVHSGEDPLLYFEDLLNSSLTSENDFQRFFETYPLFLLGTDYNRLISHPVLVRDDEHNLIPDFIMIPQDFSAPKVLDLKLPNINIARHTSNREGFLQSVMTARDQLMEYKNYFSSKSTSEYARQAFGCDIYLPKIAVVVGRSRYFVSEYERRKIESRVPDLEVITYDDILERAKQCRRLSLL